MEDGPAGVTFGAISSREGVQKSLVTYYFKTADLLQEAAAREIINRLLFRLTRTRDDLLTINPARATPSRIWARLTETCLAGTHPLGIAALEIAFLATQNGSYQRLLRRFLAHLSRLLRLPGKAPAPRSLRTCLALVIGSIATQAPMHRAPHFLIGFDDHINTIFDWPDLPTVCSTQASTRAQEAEAELNPGTEQKILAAAIRMMSTGPLWTFSHRRLAKEASVSLSSTTYYFSSKTAIIETVLGKVIESARVAVTPQFSLPENSRKTEDITQLIGRLTEYYLGPGRTSTLAQLNLTLFAARLPQMSAAMEEFYDLQMLNFRQAFSNHPYWTSDDKLEFLYMLITGHLLLSLAGYL